MSSRSRALPWFALADRLERYSVRLDELDEAGGLHSAGRVLWADDFDFERWEPPPAPPCVHRYIQVRSPLFGLPAVVCTDCGATVDGITAEIVPPGPLTLEHLVDGYARLLAVHPEGPLTATEVLLRAEEQGRRHRHLADNAYSESARRISEDRAAALAYAMANVDEVAIKTAERIDALRPVTDLLFEEQRRLLRQMTFAPPAPVRRGGWVTASTRPEPNPNPRSGFTRTRYTASGMKIEDLGGDD